MNSILVLLERKPYGGAELATHLIIKMLANEGFDLTVVTGNRNRVQGMKNVKWIYSPLLDAPSKIHLWINMLRLRLDRLSELIKACDIVYIPRLAYPAIPLAKKLGKKVIVHMHDYQLLNYSGALLAANEELHRPNFLNDIKTSMQNEVLESNGAWRAILCSWATPLNVLSRRWVTDADDIICVSKSQSRIIERELPTLADKIKVVYNPLPSIPTAEKRLDKNTIIYLGGDKYAKGFHTFLRASYRLAKWHHDVEFLLLGKYRNKNRPIIETLGKRSGGAYNLLGYIEHEEITRLYPLGCALLFPSIMNEPMPYAVLEAMLSGTLPIASRVGGVSEIVDGTFAEKMMFEPGNVEECVERMEILLTMPKELIRDVGLDLRETTLKRFDQEDIKKKILKIFLS